MVQTDREWLHGVDCRPSPNRYDAPIPDLPSLIPASRNGEVRPFGHAHRSSANHLNLGSRPARSLFEEYN